MEVVLYVMEKLEVWYNLYMGGRVGYEGWGRFISGIVRLGRLRYLGEVIVMVKGWWNWE